MRSVGLPELAFVALLIVLLALALRARTGRLSAKGPVLVLSEFQVSRTAQPGTLVTIRGRSAGVLAYLLRLLHLEGTTSLVITDRDVTIETTSGHGFSREYVPLLAVASSECAYFRPFYALVAAFLVYASAALSLLYEFRSLLWAGLAVVGTVLYMIYVVSKRISIALETNGGKAIGVAFKRSVIENVSIDLDEAIEAVTLVNKRLLALHEGREVAAGGDA